jgi:hypothetical protein
MFFLKKHVDPYGFHILEQLVAFGVEKINRLLKFCQIFWDVNRIGI